MFYNRVKDLSFDSKKTVERDINSCEIKYILSHG